MNILIIEDDEITLKWLQNGIESLGHKITLAINSEEAINKIVDNKFDLILTDIMMPGISGLSLVSALRSVYLFSQPIIMMSTLNNEPLLDAAYEAGANDFLAKPFTIKEFEDKLKKLETSTMPSPTDE